MYWDYLPEYAVWFLMTGLDSTTAQRAYGPYTNSREIQAAADIHGVTFPN